MPRKVDSIQVYHTAKGEMSLSIRSGEQSFVFDITPQILASLLSTIGKALAKILVS